jgi:hypothetical protein
MEVLIMDLTMLKKKISSYRTPKGRITNLPDELLGEILSAWEQWNGKSSAFYKELGADYRKMSSLMGRAKKLKREGVFDGLDFTEVFIEDQDQPEINNTVILSSYSNCGIELVWDNNKIIRFGSPDLLVEFLKKAA